MAKNNDQTINKNRESNHNTADHSKKISTFRKNEKKFDMVVDGVPYSVKSIPFLFNDEIRFRIILNATSEHVFTWDSEVSMLRAIDDDASVLPADVEEALSAKLQSHLKK